MRTEFSTSTNFKRRIRKWEQADYSAALKRAKDAVSGGSKNSILIIPVSSLPQKPKNNTGVGNLTSEDGLKFIDFAQKYWGINRIQLLPIGQYHASGGSYPFYSGSTMTLGNHIINIKDFVPDSEFKKIVKANKIYDRVNFSNIVEPNSVQEKVLKDLYKNMQTAMKSEFEQFKKANPLLERTSLYRALREIHNTHIYKNWGDLDKNLFNEDIVDLSKREKRISEIKQLKKESIDFYKFKQFLAEKSFEKAKNKLHLKGIKLNGDMPCGFSWDEVWAYPKAFLEGRSIGWKLPALNYDSPEAEKVLREKIRFYAKHFDGFRVDAAWTYISPNILGEKSEMLIEKKDYGDKFLKIIDEEVLKIKGENFDLKNICYELVANSGDFSPFTLYNNLKPYLKERVKIYTSDNLSTGWGSVNDFVNRGWDKSTFILGATNHDSPEIRPNEEQIEALSKIFKIPEQKLKNPKLFNLAKLSEPLSGANFMIFFMNALGIKGRFKGNKDLKLNYNTKIPQNYEKFYMSSLKNKEGFNPMEALELQFRTNGLDKKEPELYKKIIKYKKILQKSGNNSLLTGIILSTAALFLVYTKILNTNRKSIH